MSSSSPLNISLSTTTNDPQFTALKLPGSQTDTPKPLPTNSSTTFVDQNYRVLRTLSVDIHEARNVCFSPLFQPNSSAKLSFTTNDSVIITNTIANSSPISSSHVPMQPMPKYHKENLYYCLLMFNSDAIVASTRIANATNAQSSGSAFLNGGVANGTMGLSTNSGGSNHMDNGLSIGNGGMANGHKSLSSKDSIWDDSFAFDNLPLDVKELKVFLANFFLFFLLLVRLF
jgi:hypothetical protein